MRRLRVGFTGKGYQEQRNIVGLVPSCDYVLVRDVYSVLRAIRDRIGSVGPFRRLLLDAENKFRDFGISNIDVLHLYNGVSFSRTPWVSTYETILPRYRTALQYRLSEPKLVQSDPHVIRALEALAGPYCRRLIARTRNTVTLQKEFLDLFPNVKTQILAKHTIVSVPQAVFPGAFRRTYQAGTSQAPLRMMLVGHQFFSKGGREVLETLDAMRRGGTALELTIVSKLQPDSYATITGEEDVRWARDFIGARSDWIHHFERLSHHQVMKRMTQADVGLLPSYAETYGFAILEFQAHGVPVITTNVRSMPEINNNDVGWIVHVPRLNNGEAVYGEEGGRARISAAIRAGLRKAVREIISEPELVRQRGRAAAIRVQDEHNPRDIAQRLRVIYDGAIMGSGSSSR